VPTATTGSPSSPVDSSTKFSWAVLEGRDHTEIGAIEVIAEGPCAVALSRGGAPKTYSHTEPNEDACLFALGLGGALVAVADGHHGAMGSKIAVRHLLERCAERWTGPDEIDSKTLLLEGEQALDQIADEIRAEAKRCDLPPSPTTLSFVLARIGTDTLFHVSVGDSHIFVTRDEAMVDLGWGATMSEPATYLGRPTSNKHRERRSLGCQSLAGVRAVVLATDGFSEKGIGFADPDAELRLIQSRTLVESTPLRAIETCRAVAESSIGEQRRNRAGDNLGCAVWVPWPGV
jgi:serine/threonine protein phosphatase PrpC